MTNLTDNYEAKRQDGEMISVPVKASTTIYKGALVVDLGEGYASVGADGSGYAFLGVAVEKADNSDSAVDGAISVRVYKTGVFQYTKSSANQTNLGLQVYVSDDQTVATSTSNSVKCGFIVDIIDTSTVKVRINSDVK